MLYFSSISSFITVALSCLQTETISDGPLKMSQISSEQSAAGREMKQVKWALQNHNKTSLSHWGKK